MAEEKKAKKTAKKSDKKSDKKAKKNPFKAIGSFFKSVKSEGKKVVWPKANEVWKNTVTVLAVILVVGVIIYVIDLGLTEGMKGLKHLAENTTVSEETTAEETTLADVTQEDATEATTSSEAE